MSAGGVPLIFTQKVFLEHRGISDPFSAFCFRRRGVTISNAFIGVLNNDPCIKGMCFARQTSAPPSAFNFSRTMAEKRLDMFFLLSQFDDAHLYRTIESLPSLNAETFESKDFERQESHATQVSETMEPSTNSQLLSTQRGHSAACDR